MTMGIRVEKKEFLGVYLILLDMSIQFILEYGDELKENNPESKKGRVEIRLSSL
jgi:hypothetical protein